MIILGLTGSIGMGKSTAAERFKKHKIPVLDADKVVHDLYEGAAAPKIEEAFPGTVKDGKVNRAALAKHLLDNPSDFRKLEEIVHPMVHAEQIAFIAKCYKDKAWCIVLEIPLLLEGDRDRDVDAVIVVRADDHIRRQRVMQRPGMTAEKLDAIIAKQMPDDMKCHRADYIVDTSGEINDTWAQIDNIIESAKEIEPQVLDFLKQKHQNLFI